MVPVFQAFWIVFSVISGLVVYDEAKDMSQEEAGMFTLGVIVTVAGVYSLSQRPHAALDGDSTDGGQGHSTIQHARASLAIPVQV